MRKKEMKTGAKHFSSMRRLQVTEAKGRHITEYETRKKPYQLEYMEKLNEIRRQTKEQDIGSGTREDKN